MYSHISANRQYVLKHCVIDLRSKHKREIKQRFLECFKRPLSDELLDKLVINDNDEHTIVANNIVAEKKGRLKCFQLGIIKNMNT